MLKVQGFVPVSHIRGSFTLNRLPEDRHLAMMQMLQRQHVDQELGRHFLKRDEETSPPRGSKEYDDMVAAVPFHEVRGSIRFVEFHSFRNYLRKGELFLQGRSGNMTRVEKDILRLNYSDHTMSPFNDLTKARLFKFLSEPDLFVEVGSRIKCIDAAEVLLENQVVPINSAKRLLQVLILERPITKALAEYEGSRLYIQEDRLPTIDHVLGAFGFDVNSPSSLDAGPKLQALAAPRKGRPPVKYRAAEWYFQAHPNGHAPLTWDDVISELKNAGIIVTLETLKTGIKELTMQKIAQ